MRSRNESGGPPPSVQEPAGGGRGGQPHHLCHACHRAIHDVAFKLFQVISRICQKRRGPHPRPQAPGTCIEAARFPARSGIRFSQAA